MSDAHLSALTAEVFDGILEPHMDEYLRSVTDNLRASSFPIGTLDMTDDEHLLRIRRGREFGGKSKHVCRAVKGQEGIFIVDVLPEMVVAADGELRPSLPGRVIVDTATRTVEGDVQFLPDDFPGRVDENETRSFEVVWVDASGVEHSNLVTGVTREDFARLFVDVPDNAEAVDLDDPIRE